MIFTFLGRFRVMGFLQAEKKNFATGTDEALDDVELRNASKFGSHGDVDAVVPGSTFTDQQDMKRL